MVSYMNNKKLHLALPELCIGDGSFLSILHAFFSGLALHFSPWIDKQRNQKGFGNKKQLDMILISMKKASRYLANRLLCIEWVRRCKHTICLLSVSIPWNAFTFFAKWQWLPFNSQPTAAQHRKPQATRRERVSERMPWMHNTNVTWLETVTSYLPNWVRSPHSTLWW